MSVRSTLLHATLLGISCAALLPGCSCDLVQMAHTASSAAREASTPVEYPSLLLINVLDKKYYDDCHISGPQASSINVPYAELDGYMKRLKLPKTTDIVTYCSNYTCSASLQAAKDLKKMGFENVWAYEAGMAAWHQEGLPTSSSNAEAPCSQGYLKALNEPFHDETVTESDRALMITTQELQKKMEQHWGPAFAHPSQPAGHAGQTSVQQKNLRD